MSIDVLTNYIRPELVIVVAILYFIGIWLKKSKFIKDELIPVILGLISLSLCTIYILSISDKVSDYHQIAGLVFDVLIQSISCAAIAVYANQIYKQSKKLKTEIIEEEP